MIVSYRAHGHGDDPHVIVVRRVTSAGSDAAARALRRVIGVDIVWAKNGERL